MGKHWISFKVSEQWVLRLDNQCNLFTKVPSKKIVTLVMFIRIQQKAPQPWWVAPQQVGARAIRGKGSMRWRCAVEPCGGGGQKGGKWEVEVVGFLFCELFGYKKNHSGNCGRWPNLKHSLSFQLGWTTRPSGDVLRTFCWLFVFLNRFFGVHRNGQTFLLPGRSLRPWNSDQHLPVRVLFES